jgi:hypothetical protein
MMVNYLAVMMAWQNIPCWFAMQLATNARYSALPFVSTYCMHHVLQHTNECMNSKTEVMAMKIESTAAPLSLVGSCDVSQWTG